MGLGTKFTFVVFISIFPKADSYQFLSDVRGCEQILSSFVRTFLTYEFVNIRNTNIYGIWNLELACEEVSFPFYLLLYFIMNSLCMDSTRL